MSRDPTLRLQDILESITWIESYIEGYDFETFCADRKTIDAVTRCLEIPLFGTPQRKAFNS